MTLCQWMIAHEGRICDQPVVGIYRGIGGHQPVCQEHADGLRRQWGIRVEPITTPETTT